MVMTMAEKILARASARDLVVPGEYVTAKIDRAVSHEAFALVTLNLAQAGISQVWDPEKIIVSLDHYIPAPTERIASIHQVARQGVERFGLKYYYGENAGVAHQVMMEKGHVLPGHLVVGTDSHTCTYGALGAAASGIGVSEMTYVAARGELWFRVPETILFVLEGRLEFPVVSKDVILKIAADFGAETAQYSSVEFTGPGARAMSLSQRMTMSNMAVEIGAKFGFFSPDEKTAKFLGGEENNFSEWTLDENAGFARIETINISELEPQVALPHQVDRVKPVSAVSGRKINQAVLGSCANGRLEDLQQAARILGGRHIHPHCRLLVVPASREIYIEAMNDGTLLTLIEAGGVILNPGCGPCFGGHMGLLAPGEVCISSTNRNFKGRMGSDQAEVYLASPATVAASAVSGVITDPRCWPEN